MSQSHIRAVASPLPVTILEDEEGENCVASIASPWPGIDDEHRDTARTRKIAWGVYWRFMMSSVDLSLDCRREWYISVAISSELPLAGASPESAR